MDPVVLLTTLGGLLLNFIWSEIQDDALSTATGYIKDKGKELYKKLKNNEKLLREFKKFSYDYYKDEMQGIEFAERFDFTDVNKFVKEHKDEFIKLYLDCEDRKAEKGRLLDLLSKEVSPDENLRIYFDCVLNFFADYIKDSMPDTFKWVYTNITNKMSEQFEITNANIAELKEQTAKIYDKIPVTKQLIRTGDIKPTAYKGSNSDRYICRPTITNEIAGKLADNNLVFLWSEVAGLGKSETAREYAVVYKGSYSIMQIVTNGNNESLKDTIARISYDGDSEDRSIDVKYHRIIGLLSSDEKKLIIVDNYNPNSFKDDNEVIQSLADIANCDFVFTTRTKSDEYNYVDIPQLSEDDLCKVFLSIAKNQDESKVRELIRTVNNHTLVVVLVAGMISRWSQRNRKSLDDYIKEIKSNNDRIGKLNDKVQHEGKIAIPFEHIKSLFNLAGLNDMERYVMKNACLLPVSGMNFREFNNMISMISKIFEYSDIKQFLQSVQETDTSELVENEELLEILEFFNSTDESEIKNELNEFNEENNYTDVLDTLIQCNWLKEVSGNVSLHPLIAEVIEEELKPTSDDCENYIDNLFGEIHKCYEKDYGKAYSYIEVAKGMADYFLRSGEKTEKTGYLFNDVGYLCINFADYGLAIKYFEKSIAIREDVLKSNHPALASTYNNLGGAYDSKGEYDKAIEYYSKALGIYEISYKDNPNHPAFATLYNNLGGAYDNKGEYDKAIEYYSKALEILEISYKDNPNHPNFATLYNNLGGAYDNKGEYDKAIEYYSKALEILEISYKDNPNHPNLAGSYNNLGLVYMNKGEYDKAIEYYSKALEISKIAYKDNPNHPNMATSYNNLGSAYDNKGEYDKAIEYHNKALGIVEIAYKDNPNHPDFASTYNNLGSAYYNKGEYDKAIEYYSKALGIRKIAYKDNPNHPDLAISYNSLGSAYDNKGEYDKAIEYYSKALGIRKIAYKDNPNHPYLATTYNNLGGAYDNKGEYDKAIEYYNKALGIVEIAYKDNQNHPYLASTYNNLGGAYNRKGDYDKAIEYYSKALGILKTAFKTVPNHPYIKITYENMLITYTEKEDFEGARKLVDSIEDEELKFNIILEMFGN